MPEIHASPSGLFRRSTWEAELEASFERMPAWWYSPAECRIQFALWVQAQAKSLAMGIDRLAAPGPGLGLQLSQVSNALWRDAQWAAAIADGRDEGRAA